MSEIKVFGDSHSIYFRKEGTLIRRNNCYLSHDISVKVLHGASVKGLGRRESHLGVQEKILETINGSDTVVLAFGQVDVELGFYYFNIVKGKDVLFKDFAEDCVDSYIKCILSVYDSCGKLFVKGINMPAVLDRFKAIKYTSRVIFENVDDVELQSEYHRNLTNKFPTLEERIGYASYFNYYLKQRLTDLSICYFDINDRISTNGIVHDYFVPSDFDHHLVDSIYIRSVHASSLFELIIDN